MPLPVSCGPALNRDQTLVISIVPAWVDGRVLTWPTLTGAGPSAKSQMVSQVPTFTSRVNLMCFNKIRKP